MDNINFKKEYEKQIKELDNLFKNKLTHVLLVCPDTVCMDNIILTLTKIVSTKFESFKIIETIQFNKKYSNTLFFIKIENRDIKKSQKLLYYYMEKSLEDENNFFCFYTSRITIVEEMEKRVRSRFNNEIIFFPFLPLTTFIKIAKKELNKEKIEKLKNYYDINPSITNMKNMLFILHNNIDKIDLKHSYELLSNIHLVILILSYKESLKENNVVTKFKKFLIGYSELKKTAKEDIIDAYFDLIEYGFIKEKFYGDWYGFREFVNANSPFYIKSLLNKIR